MFTSLFHPVCVSYPFIWLYFHLPENDQLKATPVDKNNKLTLF